MSKISAFYYRDTGITVRCGGCGSQYMEHRYVALRPAVPPRYFGLLKGRPAEPERVFLICHSCGRKNEHQIDTINRCPPWWE